MSAYALALGSCAQMQLGEWLQQKHWWGHQVWGRRGKVAVIDIVVLYLTHKEATSTV